VLETLYKAPRLLFQNGVNPVHAISGPVGVSSLVGNAAKGPNPIEQLLYLTTLLSTAVAVGNLIPIPILDGGQILVAFIETCASRRAGPRLKAFLAAGSAALLAFLLIAVTYHEILSELS